MKFLLLFTPSRLQQTQCRKRTNVFKTRCRISSFLIFCTRLQTALTRPKRECPTNASNSSNHLKEHLHFVTYWSGNTRLTRALPWMYATEKRGQFHMCVVRNFLHADKYSSLHIFTSKASPACVFCSHLGAISRCSVVKKFLNLPGVACLD